MAAAACASAPITVNQGAVTVRQIEVQDRVAASSARKPKPEPASTQSAMAARFASLRATRPLSPPTLSAQRSPSSASSTHSMEGVLIVSPLKMPSLSFPSLVMRKILGIGQAGLWDSSRATARGESASMPCAASPPSTFCQDQVTTSSLCQGRSIAKAAEVASQIASPSRASLMKAASGSRTPEVVPFQTNTTSRSGATAPRSGSRP